MSSIDKLMIQGVRSFSPFKHQVIEFDKRLTLIVGHNGAGKTTIIETLKYITTQSLPPGVSKADWLHDPKVARQPTVNALIKLRFRDQTGRLLTATRRMEVKQTERTKSFKEISAELKVGKESVTSKCADLTKDVVARLGVSKAILENVIFCHQEDSDWPNSEPKKLKEKFDAIFDATRFKLAQDVIKKTITEQAKNLTRVDEAVKHLADKRTAAKELREEFRRNREELEKQTALIESIEVELTPIVERVDDLQSVFTKIRDLDTRLTETKTRRIEHEAQVDDLRGSITVRDADSVVLTQELREFTRAAKEKQAQLEKEQQALEDRRADREVAVRSRGDLQTKMGALKNAKEGHTKNVANRDRKVAEIAGSMGIPGYAASPLTSQQVAEVSRRLTNKATELENETKNKRRKFDGENRKLKDKVDTAKANITKNRTSVADVEERRAVGRTRKQRLEKERREIQVPGDTLAQLQQEKAAVEADLAAARNDAKAVNFDRDIAEKKGRKKTLEVDIHRLQSQVEQVNQELEKRTRVEARQRELEANKTKLQARKTADKDQLAAFFAEDVDDAEFLERYEAARGDLQTSIRSTEGEIADVRRRVHVEESAKAVAESKITEALSEQQLLRSELSREIGESGGELNNFEDVIEKRKDEAEAEKTAPAMLKMFQRFLTKAEDSKQCPLCSTDLSDSELLARLIQKLTSNIDKAKKASESNSTAADSYQRVVELRSRHAKYVTLSTSDVPDFQAESQRLMVTVTKLRDELVAAEEKKRGQVELLASLELLQGTCAEISRLADVIRDTEPEIQHERDELYNFDDSVTPDALNRQIRNLGEDIKAIDTELEAIHDDRTRKANKVGTLHGEVARLDKAIATHRLAVSKREQLDKDIRTIEAEEKELNEKVKAFARAQPNLQGELDFATREQANATAVYERESEKLQKEKRVVEDEVKSVTDLSRVVQAYIDSGKEKELARTEADIERKDRDLHTLDGQIEVVEESIRAATELLSRKQLEEREIRDNLKLRELEEEVRQARKAESDLLEEKQRFNSENKANEIEELEDIMAQLRGKKAEAGGKAELLRSNLKECQSKLKQSMYKDADENYRENLIKKKATETAIADLKKYFNALEESILRFHAIKMQEINRTIRELWEQTYTGGDIDYIEIVAEDVDAQKSKKPVDHSKRKSYSYKVMMWKGHSKMTFRGQCSAGQKVLASIIIRLALADTFCLSCGILTLDEPTTNLDTSNIDALAESLSRLIEHRSKQANFQLIIITHDMDFVQKLGRSGVADEYYKIAKERDPSSDLMISTIKRSNIASTTIAGDAED